MPGMRAVAPGLRRDGGATVMKAEPRETMLTMREACGRLNVHANTLRRWAAMGLIREYRVGPGSHRRFAEGDVAALLWTEARRGS